MCLIIASPSGKGISEEILKDAARQNAHGAGIAWLDKGKIQFRKALTVEQVKELLEKEAVGKPWVVHFRIATVGGSIPELTHPFTIDEEASVAPSGEADAVLFQNGTFGNWKDYLLQAAASSGTPIPAPPWSDTRAIAFLCHVYGKHILSLLENTSRFLIFDATESIKRRMMLWGTWEDHDGFKFSNRGNCAFHPQRNTSYGGSSAHPQTAAAGGRPDVDADGPLDEDIAADAMATAAARSQNSSPTTSTISSPGRTSRTFKPLKRHNIWRSFSADGVFVRAENEPTPTGP